MPSSDPDVTIRYRGTVMEVRCAHCAHTLTQARPPVTARLPTLEERCPTCRQRWFVMWIIEPAAA